MNEQELAEIKARAEVFDLDEWKEETDDNGDEWIRIPGGHDIFMGNIEQTSKCCYDVIHFISHARQDIPALLADVRRLTAENARLMELNEGLKSLVVQGDQLRLKEVAEVARLRAVLDKIMHELGVPQPGYLAPVANAYHIADNALKGKSEGEG